MKIQIQCGSCGKYYDSNLVDCPYCTPTKQGLPQPINIYDFDEKLICKSCGSITSSKTALKGSLVTEGLLWGATVFFLIVSILSLGVATPLFVFFLFLSLIYTCWRHLFGRRKVCRQCGNATLIPVDSPVGKDLVKRFGEYYSGVHDWRR